MVQTLSSLLFGGFDDGGVGCWVVGACLGVLTFSTRCPALGLGCWLEVKMPVPPYARPEPLPAEGAEDGEDWAPPCACAELSAWARVCLFQPLVAAGTTNS